MPKKQKHIIMARTKEMMSDGIETSKGKKEFGKHSVMWVDDAGEAREIEKRYKGKVAVTLDQQYTWSVNNDGGNGTRMDNIHNYTFQGVDTKNPGGNRRVKVKTADGYTFVSEEVALEMGYEIVEPMQKDKRKREKKWRTVQRNTS